MPANLTSADARRILLSCATSLAVSVALMSAAGAVDATPAAIEAFMAERAVIRVVDAVDREVDAKNWAGARAHFADQVRVDFSSLSGQPPASVSGDALIAGWAGNLTAAKTSLHLRTNHAVLISGDRASVTSHGYAWNRMDGNGDPLWEVWGTYEHGLQRTPEGWRVDRFTFRMTAERGNLWVKTTPGRTAP